MAKITYDNKIKMNENADIPAVNKGRAVDWNEIKAVVNTNDDNVGDLSDLNTTNKSSVVSAINELLDGEKYSTNEVKTNKVWIDNKPIYRTVVAVNFGNSGTTQTTTAHNIVNIDEITHYELRWYDTTDSCWYCNYRDVGTQYYIYMGNVSKTNVMVFQNSYDWQNRTRDRYCTIEYTKTTD